MKHGTSPQLGQGNGMDVADLPGASMLEVPNTGGVEPKDGWFGQILGY